MIPISITTKLPDIDFLFFMIKTYNKIKKIPKKKFAGPGDFMCFLLMKYLFVIRLLLRL